ncbi:hypothetical protein M8J77_000452 [Diaphorina citri]|nr:hypothetical protein M8J77_000452 [Diaphorina citri]
MISLSEDYSIPVDFVNKNLETKSLASPTGETVDLLEGYCDPRDSKAYSNPGDTSDVKIYTSPDGDYSHPYLISKFDPGFYFFSLFDRFRS